MDDTPGKITEPAPDGLVLWAVTATRNHGLYGSRYARACPDCLALVEEAIAHALRTDSVSAHIGRPDKFDRHFKHSVTVSRVQQLAQSQDGEVTVLAQTPLMPPLHTEPPMPFWLRENPEENTP